MNTFYRLEAGRPRKPMVHPTRGIALLLTVLMLDPGTALYAKTRKSDKLYKLAEQAEQSKDYEKALDFYGQALAQDPGDPAYNLGVRRMRFQVSMIHVANAKKLREQGQVEDSLHEFEKAFAADPSNALAIQEIQRTADMIKRNKAGNVKPEEANLTPAEQARKQEMDRMSTIQAVPALKPITTRIDTLKMNNQPPKVLYETIGKYAGINVIFDPQMQPMGAGGKNVNVDINNSSVEEALDYIALLTKTFWKPVTTNAIFVTEDSVTKRRDYEDNVVKVFYLRNITSVQEFQEIVTAVRSITDIRRMFTYNAQNAVMARGTPDQIALAEKLFHDLDKPKSEVVVDVIVMQANSDRTRTLAASITGGGIQLPVGFTPRAGLQQVTTTTPTTTTPATGTGTSITGTPTPVSTTTTSQGSSINLSNIGKIGFNDFSISLPGALLQAIASDSTTRILQSPQVRASDGQKVTLKIGQKVPYATGSFQPGFGGSVGGVSPLVSTQFNFAEVGVNVTITPHVHGADEVTLHVEVEISSVASQVDLGGLKQPVIAQNKEEAEIRLREGEVSLLGGLTQLQDTKTISGIPGLINLPILGLLGGSKSTEHSRSELMIALIPHIVRSPSITALDLRGVSAGTDQVVKLNYSSEPAPPAPPKATPVPPPVPAPAPQTVPPATPSTAPAPAGPPAVSFNPAATSAPLGGTFVTALNAQNVTDLFSAAPIRLKWDPKLLRLNQISPGDFLKQDGQNPPVIDIRNELGEATVNVSRTAGAAGANGSGVLAQFTFSALAKGAGTVTVTEAILKDSKQQPITAGLSTLNFTVQ